jgi:iron-sulfur cluster assembly protein
MALDEPLETDNTIEVDGFQYIVNKDFLKKAEPIKVDFIGYGFRISSGIELGGGDGCSGCGSSSSCG